MPRVVITMPAYRAERTLEQTVADIPGGVADRLILVDDASPDNTAQLARELGIDVYVHRESLGYGGNQKTCYTQALRDGADIVVLLHPDYQYEPKAVPLLIAPILAGDADMTFGSRFAGLGDPIGGGMPRYRYVGNRLTTVLENLMLGSRFSEMHSGLRAYSRDCLLSLPFLRYSDDFVFDSQLLVDAVTSGRRVVEVPIPTRYTKESSSISIARSARYIVETLRHCGARSLSRGRRGRRSVVVRPERWRSGAADESTELALEHECPVCRGRRQVLLRSETDTGGSERGKITRCLVCGLIRNAADALDGQDERRERADGTTGEVAQQIVDAIGGYAVRGERLLAAGRDRDLVVNAAAMRGWQALSEEDLRQQAPARKTQSATRQRGGAAEMHDRASEVDAVVLFAPLAPPLDPVGELQRMRTSLDREGVVALAAPLGASGFGPSGVVDPPGGSYAFTPLTLSVALDRAGFRMVEYLRLPVGGGLRARLETVAKGSSAGPGQLVSVGVALGRRAATSLGGGPTGGRAVGG